MPDLEQKKKELEMYKTTKYCLLFTDNTIMNKRKRL